MPDHLFRSNDGVYYAQMAVPSDAQSKLGKVLKRSLRTKSKAEANHLKHAVIAEFRRRIEIARGGSKGLTSDPIVEGIKWRSLIAEATQSEAALEAYQGFAADRAHELEEELGEAEARAFADVAFSRKTPLRDYVERWLSEPAKRGRSLRERTKLNYRGIVDDFCGWLKAEACPAIVESVTRKVAGRYVMHLSGRGLHPRRVNGYVTALSSYWRWLQRRVLDDASLSPWSRQGVAVEKAARRAFEPDERSFTPEEIKKLITNAPDRTLLDLMVIAALSGMRLEEVCCLTVGQCRSSTFDVPGTKTENALREVPIHSALNGLISRRSADKEPNSPLFPELSASTLGERSSAVSKRFNRYRRSQGIDDRTGGNRRSRINFHSFRRWFITEALRANQPERVVKQIVGHSFANDVTLGTYFNGDLLEALRSCVEVVQLPCRIPEAVPEWEAPAARQSAVRCIAA